MTTQRKCKQCPAVFTPRENYHRLCETCYRASVDHRQCEKCGADFAAHADYHRLCGNCYRAKAIKQTGRYDPMMGYFKKRLGILGWLFGGDDSSPENLQ